jgi:glutamate synthase (ferredoxin)
MTGGEIAVLGRIGRNFGAGMTGGMAWVIDSEAEPVAVCMNDEYVVAEPATGEQLERFWQLVAEHHRLTASARAAHLLERRDSVSALVRVVRPRAHAAPVPVADEAEVAATT